MRSGYSGRGAGPFTIALIPGSRTVVTGPSGCGKTALLMTLAGLLTPRAGCVTVGGRPLNSVVEAEIRSCVSFFSEDAHLFDTTVRDNLLVVRGDCTDDELVDALARVGLDRWLAGLPAGLDTVLTSGAHAVSAGQRRRLLLARAVISHAPVVLLDEPTEHLDIADAATLLDAVLDPAGVLFDAKQTVGVATHQVHDTGATIDVRSVTLQTIG